MESLDRSKASLGSKLAAAQEEAASMRADLRDASSKAAKLQAQLHTIHDAHSKVSLHCTVNVERKALLFGSCEKTQPRSFGGRDFGLAWMHSRHSCLSSVILHTIVVISGSLLEVAFIAGH